MVRRTVSAIIAAGGSGERFGARTPKAFIQLGNRTLLEHAVAALAGVVDEIIVTVPVGYEEQARSLLGDGAIVVTGGATRSESVRAGLAAVNENSEFVLVHDAARALASSELAAKVIHALINESEVCVIPAIAQTDTVKYINSDSYVSSTPTRENLVRVQTPQGFSTSVLKAAHAQSGEATDDAALVERLGEKVRIIDGEERALKITTAADLARAMQFLGTPSLFKTGVGVDAHAFAQGRELWLAGLRWPDEVGVDGHSDGDVAAHAICDALFAASGLGDLGTNFGVDRPEYAGASGVRLLQETVNLISAQGFSISNITVQIIGNKPKLSTRRSEAIQTLSAALGGADVSISATTTDGMGLTGEGKGIAAIASALIYKV